METINVEYLDDVPDDFTGIAIGQYGDKLWYLDGKQHRVDGPAYEWANGNKYWSLNGKSHREDGPACEYADGSKSWWLNDIYHTEDEYKKEMAIRNCSLGKLILKDGYFNLGDE